MSDLFWAIAYKITIILVGLLITLLGYILFRKGFVNESGTFSFSHFGSTISIKGAAGVFFCSLGSLIILGAIFTGIEIKSHATDGNKNDNRELTNLIVDSSILQNPSNPIKVDSLLRISKESMKKKQYLVALKYLYFIKGILVFEKESPAIQTNVVNYIQECEKSLSIILNHNTLSSFKDETRSTKIIDESADSIK